MRRALALIITIVLDSLIAIIAMAAGVVLTIEMIRRSVDVFLSLLITIGVVCLTAWTLDYFLKLRRRTRWLARAIVGLPEYDEPASSSAETALSDRQIKRKAFLIALGALVVLGASTIGVMTYFVGTFAGLGVAGLLVLGTLWLLINGGIVPLFDVIEDRIVEDETLHRDGPAN